MFFYLRDVCNILSKKLFHSVALYSGQVSEGVSSGNEQAYDKDSGDYGYA